MKIEVKGHSGCQIDVVREGKDLFVVKSTEDPKYFKRLILQAEKQKQASIPRLQHIRVPNIHIIEQADDAVRVKMDYVYSRNFVEYFEQAGFEQVEYLIEALIKYINYEVDNSCMELIDPRIITDKFADVKEKTRSNSSLENDTEIKEILDKSDKIFGNLDHIEIPVGKCHGDLTFSNILFNGNNYFLIDFLDSFIESPLLDIVKLRQDTAWHWSPLMYVNEYDDIRLKIAFGKIDDELNKYFTSKYGWYRQYYKPLQLMNFLRIIQYAHDPEVITYLKTTLKKQLAEYEA